MRRMVIYGLAVALMFGCKSAERRGSENGCDEGELAGRGDGMSDRANCVQPEPVPSGCAAQSGGTFRREKYRDAFGDAFAVCYEDAYTEQWTYAMWAQDCEGDSAVDTGVILDFQ